jgi:hypothetical protein
MIGTKGGISYSEAVNMPYDDVFFYLKQIKDLYKE